MGLSGKAGDLAFRLWDDKAFKTISDVLLPYRDEKSLNQQTPGFIVKMLRGLLGRGRTSASFDSRFAEDDNFFFVEDWPGWLRGINSLIN